MSNFHNNGNNPNNTSASASATTTPAANTGIGRSFSSKSTSSKTTLSVSSLQTSLMKKIERLSSMIDDSLESETLLPSLCSNGASHKVTSDGNGNNGDGGNYADPNDDTFETADVTAEDDYQDGLTMTTVYGGTTITGGTSSGTTTMNNTIVNLLPSSPDNHTNFASWLASQEFDASSIVWNGDDNNPQLDMSDDNDSPIQGTLWMAGGHHHHHHHHQGLEMEAADEFARDGQVRGLGDEFVVNRGQGSSGGDRGGSANHAGVSGVGSEVGSNTAVDTSNDWEDKYVSIASKNANAARNRNRRNKNKWIPGSIHDSLGGIMNMPSSVSDAWDKVASTSWQCWQAAAPLNQAGEMSKVSQHLNGHRRQNDPDVRRRQHQQYQHQHQHQHQQANEVMLQSKPYSGVQGQPKGAFERRAIDAASYDVAPSSSNTAKTKPPSILKKSSFDGRKTAVFSRDDDEKSVQDNEGQTRAAAAIKDSKQDHQESAEVKPRNLEDALSQVSLATPSTPSHCPPNRRNSNSPFAPADNSVATSIRTPLVGEEFLEDCSDIFAGTNITPQRLHTTTVNRYGMHMHGGGGGGGTMPGDSTITTTNSCTYSTSPGPAYSSSDVNTNGIHDETYDYDAFPFPMPRLDQNAAAAAIAAAAELDAIMVRKSAVVDDYPGAIPRDGIMDGKNAEEEEEEEEDDGDDDSDTPLITDKGSSASSSKSRWKGRRRRRMRMAK